MGKNVDLREFMWKVMQHVGAGKLSLREDGAIVYDAPCSCGNDLCGDELILSPERDRLLWSRWWGGLPPVRPVGVLPRRRLRLHRDRRPGRGVPLPSGCSGVR